MINNLFKSIFAGSRNVLRFLQMFCLIYSFAILVYFILDLANSKLEESLKFLFLPAYNFANLFYNRSMEVSGERIDLTGAFLMFALFGLSFFFKSLYQMTESTENTYYKVKDDARILDDMQQQKLIIQQYQLEMKKFNKLFFMVKLMPVHNKLRQGEASVPPEVVQAGFLSNISSAIRSKAFNILREEQMGKDKVAFVLDNVSSFEEAYEAAIDAVRLSNKEQHESGLFFDWAISADVGKSQHDENSKLDYLRQLSDMTAAQEVMATPTLKFCYELLNVQNYKFSSKGRYNFDHEEASKEGDELFMLLRNTAGKATVKIPE